MINKHLVVIGGGAAGLTCAGFAAKNGMRVTVIEGRERPARKILVTGKGRCNLTNNCTPEVFLKNIPTNPKFMYSAAYGFTSQQTMQLFESLGVPLKTERGNRVFPVSDSARDIVDALLQFCKQGNVDIIHDRVASLVIEENIAKGVVTVSGKTIKADYVLVATGGLSYPETGSDGKGYELAKQAGHTIVKPKASLIPIICAEKRECSEMMGLSLKNVTLSLYEKGKKKPLFSDIGEMLFTHFGVSGPLALSASAYMKKDLQSYKIYIDLKPGLTKEQLDTRLLRDFETNKNKSLGSVLGLLLPRAMIAQMAIFTKIPVDTKINAITKEQRAQLVEGIKAYTLNVVGLRPVEEAVITSGGVSVKEINPTTMESKLCKGLYFAGEVIDVDAFTGGFNLQVAFSTAFLVADGMVE